MLCLSISNKIFYLYFSLCGVITYHKISIVIVKSRGFSVPLYLCMGSQSHAPRPHIARQGREARERPKAQDKQGNAKDRDHGEQMDEASFPGKTLAGAASATPARPLPGRLAHTSGVSHPRTHGLQHHQLRLDQGSGGTSVVACRSL